jgi:hypothetical protein
MKGRWAGPRAAVLFVVTGLAAVSCGVRHDTAHTAAPQDPERAAAMKAAHQVQSTVRGHFLVATYRPNAGLHGPSNTGHACRTRTVQVRLVWNGANFTHGASTGRGHSEDRHQALVATADATSGVVCLVGADYGAGSDRCPVTSTCTGRARTSSLGKEPAGRPGGQCPPPSPEVHGTMRGMWFG